MNTAVIAHRTQEDTIRDHLMNGKAITPAIAFMVYGISRLSSVIQRLRKAGMDIVTVPKEDEVGRKYGEYKLAGELRLGSLVTIKQGHGIGLPRWVRRSEPSKVVGLFKDTAMVEFVRGTRIETHSLNVKELNHVS